MHRLPAQLQIVAELEHFEDFRGRSPWISQALNHVDGPKIISFAPKSSKNSEK